MNGHVKRIPINEFPVQGRGGQGVQLWKITQATGLICGFALAGAGASADVDFYSVRGKRLRMAVKDLPEVTRAGKGVDLRTILKTADLFGNEGVGGVAAS